MSKVSSEFIHTDYISSICQDYEFMILASIAESVFRAFDRKVLWGTTTTNAAPGMEEEHRSDA